MKGSDSFVDYLDRISYLCHNIILNKVGSYVDFTDWIKNKKATVDPIHNLILNVSNTLEQSHQTMTKMDKFHKEYQTLSLWEELGGIDYLSRVSD